MEIIKAIKRFFCKYCVVVTFNSYVKNEAEKGASCIQFLPNVNFWFNHHDPLYDNGLFVGWLVWGISIDFVSKHKKEE